jgi:hypothetical protein
MLEKLAANNDFGQMVAFGFLMLAVVAWHGISAWRKHRALQLEAELKMEMVSRGMTADDIERVLIARLAGGDLGETLSHKK